MSDLNREKVINHIISKSKEIISLLDESKLDREIYDKYRELTYAVDNQGVFDDIDILERLFVYANFVSQTLSFDKKLEKPYNSEKLQELSTGLYKFIGLHKKQMIDNAPVMANKTKGTSLLSTLSSQNPHKSQANQNIDSMISSCAKQLQELRGDAKKSIDQLNDSAAKSIRETEKQLALINDYIDEKKNTAAEILSDSEQYCKSKREEVELEHQSLKDLVSSTSQAIIGKDFRESAINERKQADTFRFLSISLMMIVVFIAAISFYDSLQSAFEWQTILLRMVLIIFISVPAGYLARESNKHREQQYNYHQTALDLQAIDPYLSSLPKEDQNNFKLKLADRIFSQKDFSQVRDDSYAINTNELLIKLMEKIDTKQAETIIKNKPKKDKEQE